jgi:hypothetical protein
LTFDDLENGLASSGANPALELIAGMNSIIALDMDNCGLTGTIPNGIYTMPNLLHLYHCLSEGI